MNAWAKWISIFLGVIALISGHMIFVADGRYFPLREGVEVAGGMKSIAEALRITKEGMKKQADEMKEFKDRYFEDKSNSQQRMIEQMERKIRLLESRPRAQ